MIAKVYADNLNSAFLDAHPVQGMEQVSVRRGRKDAFKGNLCVFIFAAFQNVYFYLGVDRLVRGNDLKDTI